MLVRCKRCNRVLCRAVAAATPDQHVVLVDVRPYARYEPDPGPAPSRRVHLTCHRDCRGERGQRTRYTLRLDRWPEMSPFAASSREAIVLGADASDGRRVIRLPADVRSS